MWRSSNTGPQLATVTVSLTRSNAEIYNMQSNQFDSTFTQHFNSVRMSFSSMGNDFRKNLPFHTQQIYTTTYHRAELLCLVAWSVLKIKASLITQVLTPTAQTIQEMSSLFPIPLPIFSKMPRLRPFNRSVLNWCRQLSLQLPILTSKNLK